MEGLILLIAAFIIILLVLREVVTWYLKQNEIVRLLKEVNQNLRSIDQSIKNLNVSKKENDKPYIDENIENIHTL